WNEVRVKGGAYGSGFQVTRSGSMRFYSYRDPRVDETLARFDAAGQWLQSFEPDEDEMTGYIVSTVAGLDAPHKPRDAARRQDGWFFAGLTPEDRAITRNQVISSDARTVRSLAPAVSALSEQRMACVFGSRAILERTKEPFETIDLLSD
ncbi:MAG: peptidase M16, partial [Eggerthellaceae bacterium]|nr:peptidase M16 [Eggerthellaceae bacterium]